MATVKQAYDIPKDVHGEIGGVSFKYPAGTVTPKDAAARAVLDRLMAIGAARPAGKEE